MLHFVAFYLGPHCLLEYTFRSLQYAEDYYCAYRISVDIAFLFLNVFNVQFLTIQILHSLAYLSLHSLVFVIGK